MKIVTIIGARPQFIKAAPVGKALHAGGHEEFILHTGQHYDNGMSQVFFDELGLPAPQVNLNVRSGGHGEQTGRMLMGIEGFLLQNRPDLVLVYGDTNSTLAGALAAVKLHIPLAHIEAGLRSFNRRMPEEHNRVLTDHCADLLLCPTLTAVQNLAWEGLTRGVHQVGDPMFDAALMFSERASESSTILERLGLQKKGYLLATVHRAYNTDDPRRLAALFSALASIEEPVILPVHPRTLDRLKSSVGVNIPSRASCLRLIDPVSYLDMLVLEQNARMILTDSGGIQKEAFFFAVPCLTLRPETEWVETVASGWNVLVGTDADAIRAGLAREFPAPDERPAFFGDGRSSEAIVAALEIYHAYPR